MRQQIINECEKEQLHLSGQIQGHGALLVVNEHLEVTHCSENIGEYLPVIASAAIGKTLPQDLLFLVQADQFTTGERQYHVFTSDGFPESDVIVSRSDNRQLLLEFYYSQTQLLKPKRPPELTTPIHSESELADYQNALIQWISEITGHERCMYYQFMDNGDGKVAGEVCTEDAEGSYLDLRFPASDIPQIARALYLLNPWRQIPDAQSTSIPVVGVSEVPDLTYCDLRSVSPVHQVYMANMGVGASVSFPIVRNGQLDALVSCHSKSPLCVPHQVLVTITSALDHYQSSLKEFDIRQRMQVIDEFNIKNSHIRQLLSKPDLIDNSWKEIASEICTNFKAKGAILSLPHETLSYGLVPNLEALAVIDQWFMSQTDQLAIHTDHLSGEIDQLPLCEVAGLCGIKFRHKDNIKIQATLYFFRDEHIHEVTWGGNPDKPTESHDGQYGISPRQSFSKWVEKRIGYSQPWPGSIQLQLLRLRALFEKGNFEIKPE